MNMTEKFEVCLQLEPYRQNLFIRRSH